MQKYQIRSKWIYLDTCEKCPNYVDFKMDGKIYKYCTNTQCYVSDPKLSCLFCDKNKANPSVWYKFKYKLKKLWRQMKFGYYF